MQSAKRTPWQITIGVWQALFLREAVARISADRVAWLWLLAEPIAHVALLVGVRTLIGRIRIIPGAESVKIHGEYWPVKAEIHNLDSMSAHGDYQEILQWLEQGNLKPEKVYVTHGEVSDIW